MTLAEQAAALSPDEIVALLAAHQALARQKAEIEARTADLTRQVEWFKRQLFGRKSERRLREPDAQQLPLTGLLPARSAPADAPHRPPRRSKPINAAPGLPPWRTRPMRGGSALTPRSRWK